MRGVRSFRAQKSGWLLAASVTVQGRVWQWFQSVVQTTQPAFTIQEVRVTQLIPDLTARPCARGVGKQSSRDMRQKWELQSEYRVTKHVVSNPLLSDVKVGFRKLGFLILKCNFKSVSTGGLKQRDVSPCNVVNLNKGGHGRRLT